VLKEIKEELRRQDEEAAKVPPGLKLLTQDERQKLLEELQKTK
jgi:hypothetical protein